MTRPTIHASCVQVGDFGVLIRGPSGAGKSMLALRLILDPPRALPAAVLVGDDRVRLDPRPNGLFACAPDLLAGLIEARFLGLRRLPYLPRTRLALVMDLAANDATRLPEENGIRAKLEGFELRRIAVPHGADGALLLAAALCGLDP